MDEKMFDRNAHILWRTGSYNVDFEDPHILTSSKISPPYMNCAKIQNDYFLWKNAVDDLGILISENADLEKINRISGGEIRDVVFSIPISIKFKKNHVIIRKGESTHGVGGRFIADVNSNEYVIHVADLRTTAKSEVSWVNAIRDANGNIDKSFSYFDRLQGGNEKLQEIDVEGYSVVQMNARFFKVGVDTGFMTEHDYKKLQDYLEKPDEWAMRYLSEHPAFITTHISVKEDGTLDVREGIDVLKKYGELSASESIEYPQVKDFSALIDEIGPKVRKDLGKMGVKESIPILSYRVYSDGM